MGIRKAPLVFLLFLLQVSAMADGRHVRMMEGDGSSGNVRQMPETDCESIQCPRVACAEYAYGVCDVNPKGEALACACCAMQCVNGVSGCSIVSPNGNFSCGF